LLNFKNYAIVALDVLSKLSYNLIYLLKISLVFATLLHILPLYETKQQFSSFSLSFFRFLKFKWFLKKRETNKKKGIHKQKSGETLQSTHKQAISHTRNYFPYFFPIASLKLLV